MDIIDISVVNGMLLGGIAVGSGVAGLFFLRFWRRTNDQLFLYFSLSFFILALNRILMAITEVSSEHHPFIYLIRLVAYGLIIFAIVERNRRKSPSFPPNEEHLRKI